MKRIALSLIVLACMVAPASAWRQGNLPSCDDPSVIAKIQKKFAIADQRTFHWGVSIAQVASIYERAPVVQTRSLIARRYCQGTAYLSDGRRSQVIYLIEAKQGFASIGYNVESCLPGFDPWHVYDGWCRAIAP